MLIVGCSLAVVSMGVVLGSISFNLVVVISSPWHCLLILSSFVLWHVILLARVLMVGCSLAVVSLGVVLVILAEKLVVRLPVCVMLSGFGPIVGLCRVSLLIP